MNKTKEIEEMAKELHCATNESFISCRKIARILVERRGYGNIKQYQNEIERLETELAHREEDLIHADEKVFYRETAVKLDEDKIKKQAVKEFAEKIEKLLCVHENQYSHLCKSKKECHDETCRYQAILRLHKEITELYGADE